MTPMPASESILCKFVAYLAMADLSHSTIKWYLSAVRHLQIEEEKGDPRISQMARLEQVLRGIKCTQARAGIKRGQRLPTEDFGQAEAALAKKDDARLSNVMGRGFIVLLRVFFARGS